MQQYLVCAEIQVPVVDVACLWLQMLYQYMFRVRHPPYSVFLLSQQCSDTATAGLAAVLLWALLSSGFHTPFTSLNSVLCCLFGGWECPCRCLGYHQFLHSGPNSKQYRYLQRRSIGDVVCASRACWTTTGLSVNVIISPCIEFRRHERLLWCLHYVSFR